MKNKKKLAVISRDLADEFSAKSRLSYKEAIIEHSSKLSEEEIEEISHLPRNHYITTIEIPPSLSAICKINKISFSQLLQFCLEKELQHGRF